MDITNYINLLSISIIPIIVSVVVYIIDDKFFNNARFWTKQIILGLIFGGVSILGTEMGYTIDGATMNIRDSAPIIAGLVFGAPSGIIAAVIGSTERWFAVYWGAGMYTRLACTLSTLIAGLFAAFLRVNVFENKIPRTIYAFVTGTVIEIIHMFMVFLTHVNDPEKAFAVVRLCTGPLVVVNTFTIGISIYLIHLYRRGVNGKGVKKIIDINRVFQKRILILVLVAFFAANVCNYVLQNGLASNVIDDDLTENINDVLNDIDDASSSMILKSTEKIVAEINSTSDTITYTYLKELLTKYDISEINIINRMGEVTISTGLRNVGFNIYNGERVKDFACLFDGVKEYTKELDTSDFNPSMRMKYAGISLSTGNIVLVGYNEHQYYDKVIDEIKLVARNRHIGATGGLIIVEKETGRIVSDNADNEGKLFESVFGDGLEYSNIEFMTRYPTSFGGTDYYYMVTYIDGYYVISYQSVDEAFASSEISLYLTSFTQVIIYAFIFIVLFIIIDSTIVKNVEKVNFSLKKIAEGELDTIVDVKHIREFAYISDNINNMVDKLKLLIHQNEEKMRQELEYAAEIQRSALPSEFPAFPDRDEFDIYASMDPAKEVGGDFYDFYFVDGGKLAILVADVSGKGIPASLFMMKSKAIIKSYAQYGISVEDVFTNANYNLCEGNEAGLFVTAWMALIDLATGHVEYANAGHNPPLIKHPDGKYEYLRTRPGFVLGGMEGVVYKKFEFDIEPGSEIFVYTDGLTEAQNLRQELYGEDRLLEAINEYEFDNSENICKYITKKVDEYVGEADQFDDLTMLHFKFIKKM